MNYNAPFSILSKVQHKQNNAVDFFVYYTKMDEELEKELSNQDAEYFELSRMALSGQADAVPYFLNIIRKYLINHPFAGTLPEYYRSVEEGLFHEWKGFSSLHEWFHDKKYALSSGLQIIGTKAFFREKGVYRPYPYRLPSISRANKLLRQLLSNNSRLQVDMSNPDAELNMTDPLWPDRFLRIAIWAPDRVWDDYTTITIRRQIIDYLSLYEQAGSGSIPSEVIPVFDALCQLGLRIVVAGPVDSGKSTFANTLVGHQLTQAPELGLIMIEKHPESLLPIVFPDHRIVPVKADDHELMRVGFQSLRMDPEIVFMTEMRYYEWEFFLYAGEKGHKNLIGTYHTTDAEDIPYQAANAVHAIRGGSLRAHLISALKSCELVIVMAPGEEGKKRVVRLSEIVFDENENIVYANDIMRYDKDKDTWLFNGNLSSNFIKKSIETNAAATDQLINHLRSLSASRKINNPVRVSLKSQMVLN